MEKEEVEQDIRSKSLIPFTLLYHVSFSQLTGKKVKIKFRSGFEFEVVIIRADSTSLEVSDGSGYAYIPISEIAEIDYEGKPIYSKS